MQCPQCGEQVQQHFKFCGKCGREIVAVPVPLGKPRDMGTHVTVLGWLMIISSLPMAALGLGVASLGGLLMVPMIPMALLTPWPVSLMGTAFGAAAASLALVMLGWSLLAIAAGVGLLRFRSWARVLVIALALLGVMKFPFGTALAIYAFWVLLSTEGRDYYVAKAAVEN